MEVRDYDKALDRPYMSDPVQHPDHYTWHPSGVECILIAKHFNYSLGNVIKYTWRAGCVSSPNKE